MLRVSLIDSFMASDISCSAPALEQPLHAFFAAASCNREKGSDCPTLSCNSLAIILIKGLIKGSEYLIQIDKRIMYGVYVFTGWAIS